MHLPDNTLLQGGKYRIIRFIASGGFGCTYEAEHVMLGKRVAIKEFFVKDFCNRDETTSCVSVGTLSKKPLVDKLKRKFIEEAVAIGTFSHPNIIRVSDVFEENDTAYYVMDYIKGKTLNALVRDNGKLSEAAAIKYIVQVSEALKDIHSQNRLHLDIKPSNIMVDERDNAVLIDFGASKQYDEVDGENTSTLVGRTPGYAPLEQMGNDIVKFMPATDIYALGATLYKLISGVTPLSATLLASGEDLDPLPPTISTHVRECIKRSMSINKNKRPQSVPEFIALLDNKADFDEVTQLDSFNTVHSNPITQTATSGYQDGFEWIDLGLSSGLRWATCNIGAKAASECGDRFVWGEFVPATNELQGERFCSDKDFSSLRSCKAINQQGNLIDKHDAASTIWGKAWRMPTLTDVKELLAECKWMWTAVNDVNGYRVKGANGNSIFLPVSRSRGYYWTSSVCDDKKNAYDLYLYSFHVDWSMRARNLESFVRPVLE